MVRPSNLWIEKRAKSVDATFYLHVSRHLRRSGQSDQETLVVGIFLLDVVHGGDGSLGIIFVGVANKSESTASTSVTVLDHNLV